MNIKISLFVNIFPICFLFGQSLPVPTTLDDFFLPGSQPNESGDLSNPASCNCHDFNGDQIYGKWEGSMMAHALVDPLFTATMAVAQQDAANSGDLCLRCHTPTGWLSGRSVPTDGSNLITDDESSVNCMFCHRSVHPAQVDENPYTGDTDYTVNTWPQDHEYLAKIDGHIPAYSANGMYVVDTLDNSRRGPFIINSGGNHDKIYSPFHESARLCGTCHDVSNPVYSNDGDNTYTLNAPGDTVPEFSPYEMFPVERTYSEWLNSSYNTMGGIGGTVFGGTKTSVSTCQDCHMAQINTTLTKSGTNRDIGIHDMTGGNTFIPLVLSSMTQTVKDESIARASFMLQNAATMNVQVVGTTITVTVYNETGHKLPSGYPEGRRIWLNVQAFDINKVKIYESGEYDNSTGVLIHDDSLKVYEIKPGLTSTAAGLTGLTAGPSFHFVLNDTIYKDNRIPPRGYSISAFEGIQSPPVDYDYEEGQYWDISEYKTPQTPDSVSVTLYYQTTSKEYVEFLLNEVSAPQTEGQEMYNFWNDNGKSAPVVMVQQLVNNQDIALYVNLTNLSLEMGDHFPVLSWITQAESENLGFIIYRREESETEFREISSYKSNPALKGLGNSSSGRSYLYEDADSSLIDGRTYIYKVTDISYSGVVTEHGPLSLTFDLETNIDDQKTPRGFTLKGNYPNPFNGETIIQFYNHQKQTVEIIIYDVSGKVVREFPQFLYYAGENKIKWDARDNFGNTVPSGVYFYSLKTRRAKKTGKMIVVK